MNFFREIKNKAINATSFGKTQNKQSAQNKITQTNEAVNQLNVKTIAKQIFNRFKKTSQPTSSKESDNKNKVIQEMIKNQGKFWHVNTNQSIITEQPASNQNNRKQQQNFQLEISQEDAVNFVQNIHSFASQRYKYQANKQKIAKKQIFGCIEIQPIYMIQDNQTKILNFELESSSNELIQRSQALVLQKNSVQRSIQKALFSGYMWGVNNLQNICFISACFQIVQKNYQMATNLLGKVEQTRKRIKLNVQHFKKVSRLSHRICIARRKLQMLKTLKSYKKDVLLQFNNVDQAFYIQRNRQKMYNNLKNNSKLTQKVVLLKNLEKSIQAQNIKLINLLQNELSKWIDLQQNIEAKHKQKILILIYFTKHEAMYTDNKIQIQFSGIKNTKRLISQINEVKQWKDYKYVNDRNVKAKVNQFLNHLLTMLSSEQQVNMKNKNKKMSLVIKQNNAETIKLGNKNKRDKIISDKYSSDNNNNEQEIKQHKNSMQNGQKSDKQQTNTNAYKIIILDEVHKAKQKIQNVNLKF